MLPSPTKIALKYGAIISVFSLILSLLYIFSSDTMGFGIGLGVISGLINWVGLIACFILAHREFYIDKGADILD